MHYILHNIDTVIVKIENRGPAAPITPKEFKMMLKLMYEVRQINLKDIKAMQTYSDFVYNIACNVPFSTNEEGQINKKIGKTETRQY